MIEQIRDVSFKRGRTPALLWRWLHERARSFARPSALGQVLVLATCERVEVVYAGPALLDALALAPSWAGACARRGAPACRHVLRVAAGLDSRLIGEPHVLGQVRRAFADAEEHGTIGPALLALGRAASRAGRRVRAETPVGRIGASYVTRAVERIESRFGSLDGRAVGVVGSGAMARDLLEALRGRGPARLVILARHESRRSALAQEFGAEPVALDMLPCTLAQLDAVALATSAPGPVLDESMVAPRSRALVVVDLGTPPNAGDCLARCKGLELITLDDLAAGAAHAAFASAEEVIDNELARLAVELEAVREPARLRRASA